MSGDVQPRKRKDKKKKRDDEASHGVHVTKMGSEDVLLHIHEDHGTGGHWCAKIVFFSLMTILMGLVCLIILENRGISDMDTPLSESRFSNYFDGWVDEHRGGDHGDNHDNHGSLEHDDHDEEDDEHGDEDDNDEPFEEEADHSEGDGDEAEKEDDNVTPEEDSEDVNGDIKENVAAEDDDDDEDDDEDDEGEEGDEEDNVVDEEEYATEEDENLTKEAIGKQDEDEDDNNEDDKDIDDGDGDDDDEYDNNTKETSKPTSQEPPNEDDDPFDEDDDGEFDSLEKIVDNDAAELELLKEKARQQAAAESKQTATSAEDDLIDGVDSAPSWASSLTIKIGVGLALALVARLVLIRKHPISNEEVAAETIMKRRATIIDPQENIIKRIEDNVLPPLDDDYSEEEIEIEEEIEYIDDEGAPIAEENEIDAGDNEYVPETFEQLNAMYRLKDNKAVTEQKIVTKSSQTEVHSYSSPHTTFQINNNRNNNNNKALNNTGDDSCNKGNLKSAAKEYAGESPPSKVSQIEADVQSKIISAAKETAIKPQVNIQPVIRKDVSYDMDYEKVNAEKPKEEIKREITHDLDYQPDADDIDYDEEDDVYDDEEGQDNDSEDLDDEDLLDDDEDEDLEDGDDEDVSDIDDAELMTRLEAKYGKLPAKEYESDEDPDDPTWTQIKPKTGSGGPQSLEDDNVDLFEKELRRANDEMMREFNYH